MNEIINFLQKRRSITAKKMDPGKVEDEHLENIIKCGLRVPDHGALSPWKIKIIKGKSRKNFGEQILLPEFLKDQENPSPSLVELEINRFTRASVVLIVISTPIRGVKIPTWEMQLSAGAVCQNLLLAAQSYSYAAQWLTEWYSYNENVLCALGGDPTKDKIAGCIYIGTKHSEPTQRKRPVFDESVAELEL
jgi:nitroreductase